LEVLYFLGPGKFLSFIFWGGIFLGKDVRLKKKEEDLRRRVSLNWKEVG